MCGVVSGSDIRLIDTRTMEISSHVPDAHVGAARLIFIIINNYINYYIYNLCNY